MSPGPASPVALGPSGLRYDVKAGHYVLTVKTQKSWASTCRRVVLRLGTGQEILVGFTFK